ncbi:hypothetical protein M4578_04210 [Salipiger sp. P9]|nr:hypothetical protein [Salipiger pentaromativorans]
MDRVRGWHLPAGVALVLGLLLAAPVAAQQWGPYDGTIHSTTPGNAGAAPVDGGAICQGHRSGYYCIVVGCLPGQPIGLYLVSEALAKNGLRSAHLMVDGRNLGYMLLEKVEGRETLFGKVIPSTVARHYISRMRSGSQLEIRLQDGSDMLSYVSTLRGSSRAIANALARCPAPGTPEPRAGQAATPAPAPAPVPQGTQGLDPLDSLFVANGCTASEAQIYDLMSDGGRSIGDGQAQFMIWVRSPGWHDAYEVINRSPFVYRWKQGPCAR